MKFASAFWDVLPTFAEITGINPTENIDGISFLPALLGQGDRQQEHDHLYWEFHERGGRVALRKGDWKLLRYNVNHTPPGEFELYNLVEDPSETNDLSESLPEKAGELQAILEAARTESEVFKFTSKSYNAESSGANSTK